MVGRPSTGPAQHLKGARLGARLRALREERGWTRAHLAEAAGVSLRTLKRIETAGSAAPGLFTVAALAAALGVTVDALVAHAHGMDATGIALANPEGGGTEH
ncbi:helix-turn-helix domain-containing protein [Streptomyces sp. NPDC054775]